MGAGEHTVGPARPSKRQRTADGEANPPLPPPPADDIDAVSCGAASSSEPAHGRGRGGRGRSRGAATATPRTRKAKVPVQPVDTLDENDPMLPLHPIDEKMTTLGDSRGGYDFGRDGVWDELEAQDGRGPEAAADEADPATSWWRFYPDVLESGSALGQRNDNQIGGDDDDGEQGAAETHKHDDELLAVAVQAQAALRNRCQDVTTAAFGLPSTLSGSTSRPDPLSSISLLGDGIDYAKYGSEIRALVTYVRRVIEADPTAKLILFSQFCRLTTLISRAFSEFQIPNQRMAGGNVFTKRRAVTLFRTDPNMKVLFLPSDDCVPGRHLVEANHVVIVHPFLGASETMTRAYELQGIARAVRAGQTREMTVVRFVTCEYGRGDDQAAHGRAPCAGGHGRGPGP